ncbi:MADS-box transcription factor 14-like isoform X2 [Cryptomeria japonica]|uniref:MADS-box transcription factor 14-like isoform X2 n=1 Tax=Cryptomeria japonica TaxID=3369 RepID=UPI0027DA747D|nr:MADS-box transcription factor 14-like isoform X2 [Cryptomeria japonica]
MTQLEKIYRHMIGEDLELLNFKELQRLEKKIKLGVRKIHSRKEKTLTVESTNLEKRIEKSRRKHLNIDIMEGVTNDLKTQQDPPQTDLNLALS